MAICEIKIIHYKDENGNTEILTIRNDKCVQFKGKVYLSFENEYVDIVNKIMNILNNSEILCEREIKIETPIRRDFAYFQKTHKTIIREIDRIIAKERTIPKSEIITYDLSGI